MDGIMVSPRTLIREIHDLPELNIERERLLAAWGFPPRADG